MTTSLSETNIPTEVVVSEPVKKPRGRPKATAKKPVKKAPVKKSLKEINIALMEINTNLINEKIAYVEEINDLTKDLLEAQGKIMGYKVLIDYFEHQLELPPSFSTLVGEDL